MQTIYEKQNKNTKIKKKKIEDLRYIYQNELDKACFQHNMAYDAYKDLPVRTTSDKLLCNKASVVASDLNYDGYQRGLAPVVYKFCNKKI